MKWDLHVAGPARKQLERLPSKDRERILAVLVAMQDNPFQGAFSISRISLPPFAAESVTGGFFLIPIPAVTLVVVTAIERRTTTTYRKR